MNIKAFKAVLIALMSSVLLACNSTEEETPSSTTIEETTPAVAEALAATSSEVEIDAFNIEELYDEAAATKAEVMMQAYLEENRGWCLDAPSSTSGIAGLHTHTCYLYRNDGADGPAHDQAFVVELVEEHGIFYLVDYDLCLTMFEPEEGSFVALEQCGGELSHLQKFTMNEDGLVASVLAPELCMTTGDYTTPGGGGNPMHIIRKLTFETCDESQLTYQAWELRTEWLGLADDSLITEERTFPNVPGAAMGAGMGAGMGAAGMAGGG